MKRPLGRQSRREEEIAVITLYAMRSPNVYKVAIMLEETGLPYRLQHVRLGAGDHLKT